MRRKACAASREIYVKTSSRKGGHLADMLTILGNCRNRLMLVMYMLAKDSLSDIINSL
jgi:hypothetical protein